MSSKSKQVKRDSCHSAKCRRAFLYESVKNGNGKDVKKYFKLMGRLGAKDNKFLKYMKSDLKYFEQKGGACDFYTEKDCKNNGCTWNEELEMCHSNKNANFSYNPANVYTNSLESSEAALENQERRTKAAAEAVNRLNRNLDLKNLLNNIEEKNRGVDLYDNPELLAELEALEAEAELEALEAEAEAEEKRKAQSRLF